MTLRQLLEEFRKGKGIIVGHPCSLDDELWTEFKYEPSPPLPIKIQVFQGIQCTTPDILLIEG